MKATTGERPHVKILAASKANDAADFHRQPKFGRLVGGSNKVL